MADQHLPAAPSPRDNIYAVLHIHVIYNQDNNSLSHQKMTVSLLL